MGLWRLIRTLWRANQRRLDCELLWPVLVEGASGDVRWAQNSMLLHCMTDAAWRDEMDEVSIYRVIAALTALESAGNRSPWKCSAPSKAP
jgi:hypothetical protein